MTQDAIHLMPPSFAPYDTTVPPERRMAVLMSGGVDSSVTAHLLKGAGFEVVGITMKVPVSCDANPRGCCGADAAFVCQELGIAHYFVDVTEPFHKLIIDRFRTAYAQGRTPNPCVDCNSLLKFSLVWDLVEESFGITRLATGHYARVLDTPDGVRLARGVDPAKDQSYFLYGIPAHRLAQLALPLGDRSKTEIRTLAEEIGLSVAEKPESMELCFAGEGDYRIALSSEQADRPGDLTDMTGKRIGAHKGISHYTLGQRKGLGFAGGKPLYVGRIDPESNTVALGTREEVSFECITANEPNILVPDEFTVDARVFGKIRSYGDPHPCTIPALASDTFTARFDESRFAPCPGQKLVLYNAQGQIIAGGTINSASHP